MIVEPTTREVTTWQDLHLFHFGMSNCSQRVRIMLEEKGLPWTSHVVDIPRGDNLTDYYQGINPNGVVPTLVHDGTVHIESTDILEYLDGLDSTQPPLFADEGIEPALRDRVIERANSAQAQIKVLSFEYLFKPVARKSRKEIEQLDGKLRNRELFEFHKRFSAAGGFDADTLQRHVCTMEDHLQFLEQTLRRRAWLAGERLSVADVAWIVNVHRLKLMHFPMQHLPGVCGWFERMAERPSYASALKAYEPGAAVGVVRLYAWFRAHWGSRAFDLAPC